MKTCVIILLLTLGTYSSFSQVASYENLYLKSLESHLDYIIELDQSSKRSMVYVNLAEGIKGNLPDSVSGLKVYYVTPSEIRANAKKLKSFYLISIQPVQFEDGYLKINIVDQSVSFKKRKILKYVITGGSSLGYIYDCNQNKFILKTSQHSGV